jgi:hypothetical protein
MELIKYPTKKAERRQQVETDLMMWKHIWSKQFPLNAQRLIPILEYNLQLLNAELGSCSTSSVA